MSSMAQVANDDDWGRAVRAYRKNSNDWDRRRLGPRPGHDGCRCPAHILAEVGFPLVLAFPPKDKAIPKGRTLISYRASDINPERIEWVWPGRIARGKHTGIAGDPGTGKSQLLIAMAAAITTGGSWPCGEGYAPLGSVIILSAEDGAADTLVPRLMAAGADLARVHIIKAVRKADGKGQESFNLQGDLDLLDAKIREVGDCVMVGIDPVSSYIGSKTDSHKNSEVRQVLEPLSLMAERLRVAVVSVTHFSKGGSGASTKAMHRFIGSIAFIGAPRAAFVVIEDSEDNELRLFLQAKNYIAPHQQGLAYRLKQHIVADGIVASSVAWENEPVTMTANQALAADGGREDGAALQEAVEFLRAELTGGPISRKTVKAGADANGISQATLRRAKSKLGVKAHKDGMAGGWFWQLPSAEDAQSEERLSTFEGAQENTKVLNQKSLSTFENSEHLRADCRAPDPCQQQTQIAGTAAPGEDFATDIPVPYAQQLRALQAACPAEVPRERWQLCLGDALRFFGKWGRQAHKLGWTAHDLLGLHPTAPLARHDEMGLLWTLRGQSVADLGARAAKLSGGLTMRRRSS
jgi:putative DNA primase/helicase